MADVSRILLAAAIALCVNSASADSLVSLMSAAAVVVDQETGEVLMTKNAEAVRPIASLTKLMTALVVVESALPMDEVLTVTQEDVDLLKHTSSRLAVGSRLTRGELLQLALMSSENRAASALGRSFPGGKAAFVATMNLKALQLGMGATHYVEPTGLSSENRSSASDLVRLVGAALEQEAIRRYSTSINAMVRPAKRAERFGTTNALLTSTAWDIGLQKTGYIVEAGRCLVLQAKFGHRKVIAVLLGASDTQGRTADAEHVRRSLGGRRP